MRKEYKASNLEALKAAVLALKSGDKLTIHMQPNKILPNLSSINVTIMVIEDKIFLRGLKGSVDGP